MAKPIAALKVPEGASGNGLEEELRQADRDFAQGDFIDVTLEQLDQRLAAGEWPWASASSA
ncbi:MAG TPA: hypothetical protein VL137_01045 [Polyangiaceae bacterium]|jgi:hypothetical protein|nr:hypothetical protein [Polyangiaceae bacterium]